MAEIKHLLHIKADARKIYQALVDENGLKGWWTDQTVGGSGVGAIIEFKFGEQYHNKMKIIHLEPDKTVEWICLDGDPQWIDTKFIFKLESTKDDTVLSFTHANWLEMTDFFASCNYHWGYYLRSLKLLCETGKGTPFKE